jgi:hypothetical protein
MAGGTVSEAAQGFKGNSKDLIETDLYTEVRNILEPLEGHIDQVNKAMEESDDNDLWIQAKVLSALAHYVDDRLVKLFTLVCENFGNVMIERYPHTKECEDECMAGKVARVRVVHPTDNHFQKVPHPTEVATEAIERWRARP